MPDYTSAVEEIKQRCNIVDLIGSVVSLKKSGSSYMACCPFHNEKTPSFSVSEKHQYYHCFGCGESGDIFSFEQKYYNLSFIESVEKLAAQYGIHIEKDGGGEISKKRSELLEINRISANHFYSNLKKKSCPGYDYLRKRGISDETIKTFGLGFAEDGWNDLLDFLHVQHINDDSMLELGLISRNEKNGKLYDKYRNRVIFPIVDTKNKVIGFGGRIITDEKPKYLNSAESSVFLKKNNLFGLNKAKEEITVQGYAFLVEGYMDMVSMFQAGIKNTVASLGTSLTESQAKLLHRYCSKVILCYDADAAGVRAALRGIDILRSADMEVSVLHVNNAKDPDEYIKKYGPEKFLQLAKTKSLDHVDYKLALISKKYDRNDNAQSVKFIRAVCKVLAGLTPAEQDVYTKHAAEKYNISIHTLENEMKLTASADAAHDRMTENTDAAEAPVSRADLNLEKMCIRLSLINSDVFEVFAGYMDYFSGELTVRIFRFLLDVYKKGSEFDMDFLRDNLDEDAYNFILELSDTVPVGDQTLAFEECLTKLKNKKNERRRMQLKQSIKTLEDYPPGEERDKELNAFMKELAELNKKVKDRAK